MFFIPKGRKSAAQLARVQRPGPPPLRAETRHHYFSIRLHERYGRGPGDRGGITHLHATPELRGAAPAGGGAHTQAPTPEHLNATVAGVVPRGWVHPFPLKLTQGEDLGVQESDPPKQKHSVHPAPPHMPRDTCFVSSLRHLPPRRLTPLGPGSTPEFSERERSFFSNTNINMSSFFTKIPVFFTKYLSSCASASDRRTILKKKISTKIRTLWDWT